MTGSLMTGCTLCGPRCLLWYPVSTMGGFPPINLFDVYRRFFDIHHDISFLVDSSKNPSWLDVPKFDIYQAHLKTLGRCGPEDNILISLSPIIASKHPLRLAASFVYNKQGLVPNDIKRDSFAACMTYIYKNSQDILAAINDFLRMALRFYAKRIPSLIETLSLRLANSYVGPRFSVDQDFWHVSTDSSDSLNNLFVKLFDLHQIQVNPVNRLSFDFHSIGGNKSVYWQYLSFAPQAIPDLDLSRRRYYENAFEAKADEWHLIDNKFQHVFSDEFTKKVANLSSYGDLVERLGYDSCPR